MAVVMPFASVTANDRPPVLQLREILEARLSLMPSVARYKWHHSIPVEDLERETLILAATVEQAKALGLTESAAKRLVSAQITAAKQIQRRLITIWQQSDVDLRTLPPLQSLSDDIRPVISGLTVELLTVTSALAQALKECAAHEDLQANRLQMVTDDEWRTAVTGLKPEGLDCE